MCWYFLDWTMSGKRLLAHHRRLVKSRVSAAQRAAMERDFAAFDRRTPCWARLLPLQAGSLAALLPAADSAFADDRPIPHQEIALAQLPRTVCIISTLTNPHSQYRKALGRAKPIPNAAGRSGLTVALAF